MIRKHEFKNIFLSDSAIICHQVNCLGAMGAGIAKQMKQKYPENFNYYKKLCDELNISIEELINGEKDNSDKAKEKAILSVVKLKDKEKRKLKKVITISILIIVLLIITGIIFYKRKAYF